MSSYKEDCKTNRNLHALIKYLSEKFMRFYCVYGTRSNTVTVSAEWNLSLQFSHKQM